MFTDAYDAFRKNRFRSKDDLLVTSYLNPCVGYFTGRTLFTVAPYWYVKIREPKARDLYSLILKDKGKPTARMSVCTNDHPEGELENPEAELTAFLKTYFPRRGPYEKGTNALFRRDYGRSKPALET